MRIVIRKSMKESHESLAKKHGVSIEHIEEELKIGEKEELEHTSSPAEAHKIAMDHISENPNYYKKLKEAGLVEKAIKDLSYWKKKLLGILEGDSISKSLDDLRLRKGRGYAPGTIREWKGKKFKKLSSGKWMRTYTSVKEKGERQAYFATMKKIKNAKSIEELQQIVQNSKERFSDDKGNYLPTVETFMKIQSEGGWSETLPSKEKLEAKKKENKYDGPKATSEEMNRNRKVHEGRSLSINKMNLEEAKNNLKGETRPAMVEAIKSGINQLEEIITEKESKQKPQKIVVKKPMTNKEIGEKAKLDNQKEIAKEFDIPVELVQELSDKYRKNNPREKVYIDTIRNEVKEHLSKETDKIKTELESTRRKLAEIDKKESKDLGPDIFAPREKQGEQRTDIEKVDDLYETVKKNSTQSHKASLLVKVFKSPINVPNYKAVLKQLKGELAGRKTNPEKNEKDIKAYDAMTDLTKMAVDALEERNKLKKSRIVIRGLSGKK